ncbi:PDZ domain-containing protein 7-like isoform X5 [Scylla paramamosain]|uniref:PDZ domain-containing protein 7-like isoform X5 n=1 Tax=Scylla paramamosain TaxID=85552 RepID=UPI0030830895
MRDGGPTAAAPLEAAHGPPFRPKTPLGSTSSCSSSVAGGGRVRAVRLVRRKGETYGFSLRGGKEHGTGFFISHVEPGSEAFLQGLRAGDQVVRVNNMAVDQAVHREVTAMVQSKASVLMHIRSTGIIPLKEHRGDPLTWLVVDDDEELSDHGTDSYSGPSMEATPPPHHRNHHHPAGYARVYLSCSGKVGLGCSICKGPPEKPGIFVQSVKVGGVARSAGLRPGDQVIACNDVSFAHLEFAEAVYVLKSSPRLVLDVLHGAGMDLVAGESSGYNSSASSVAGDQTPPSSSSDPRDSDHSVASRLSAVSRHLTLDRSRGWQEIEDEWAEAEAADKRKQLQASQKILKTRAQRDASHRLSNIASRSLSSLSAALREEEYEEQRTAFRDAKPSPVQPACHLPSHLTLKSTLRSSRSTDDLSEDTSHKIALLTSADPHVNNIVVTGGPKDERDAVFRLEQLSSASASRTSTLSSGTSQVTVRSSSGSGGCPSPGKAPPPPPPQSSEYLVEQQLQELRREQKRLQEEASRLAEERRRFEDVQRIEAQLDQFKKDKPKSVPVDPKMAQYAKLMEEIKIKQKKMLTKDNTGVKEEEEKEEREKEAATKESSPPPKDPSPPSPPIEFSSKIINRSQLGQNKDKEVKRGSIGASSLMNGTTATLASAKSTTPSASATNTLTKPRISVGGAPSKLPVSRTNTAPGNQVTSSLAKSAVFETQVSRNNPSIPPPPPPPPPPPSSSFHPAFVCSSSTTSTFTSSPPHSSPVHNSFGKLQNGAHLISSPPHPSPAKPPKPPPAPPAPGSLPVPAALPSLLPHLLSGTPTLPPSAQWSERVRGSKGPSPAVPSKPRPHSTYASSTSMEEFRPEDKQASQPTVKPPSAFFEPQKKTTGKPLVSISAYPSPNQRPTPVRMDFLPQASAKVEVNGVSAADGPSTKIVLQDELKSTLTRSNLRQRSTTEQVFEGLPPQASSSSSKPSFTTTTIVNTASPPKASLSSKYSHIGQNNTGIKGESSKENEAPECPPAGILKPSGPSSTIRPLQKSISFGDVTTVGESEPRA